MTSTTSQTGLAALGTRILSEGYGPGAWHGPDLHAALADVTAETAFRRPAKGRHNIAEIVLHHAHCIHNVRAQISKDPPEPFALEGEDWFPLNDPQTLTWTTVQSIVANEQRQLVQLVSDIEAVAGGAKTSLAEDERFNLLLGITCHAVYHAGQVQLIKRLIAV